MAFAALAKRAKAASAAEPAFESSRDSSHESAALHHANQTLLDNKELSKSDANGLPLPTVGSALPEHPSTKPRPASKSSAPKQDSALLQKIREQIAKEEAEEKLSQANSSVPQPDSSPPTLPLHLRTKEGTESTGNTDCVNCFTLFCNGEFASGSGDGRVLIWNEGTGEVIQVLQNHHGPVLSMTTDSTGRKLVTGSSDMSMKKWDLTRPVISQDLEFIGHNRWVQSVAVHGHFVFSASLDKTVRQWDLHSGKCNFIFAGHSDWVSSLCVHQETLYTGSWDGFVRLWNVSTWECTYLFEGHKGPVLAICLDVKEAHQKPSFIYSASQDGSVKRWSLKDHVESNTYSGHILGVSSIDCSSKLLASGSFDSTIRLYDLESHDVKAVDPCHVLHGHEDSVTCIKLSKDDLYLYSSSDDFTIRKWDCKTGLCLRIYGIPRSQQLIGGLGSASKASGSLSLLLNFGDDDDPTSLRARIRRILREEENESVLLEHEYSRRLEMYRNRLQADHLKESKGQKKNDGSVQPGDDGFEDSVIIDLKDDFLNQRYELIAVYSDAKEALREDVLDCAGLGVTAVQLLWENKQEGLKVAWLESKFKSSSSTVQTAASEVSELDSSDGVAKVAASSILNEVLCGVLSHTAECVSEDILKEIVDSILIKQTPQDIAEDILKGIMDLVCITHPSTAAIVAPMPSFQKPVFDASSAKIDVSDVTLADVLSPQLLACLNSILHRANRRYNRSKAVFNTKFFESAMTQADQRDCRLQILQAGILDREERKMLLQQEETRILALISGEAREIHTILTQVASEIDRLISDHRQLWLFKFSGLFTDSQWNELDSAVADLIRKHQLKSDALYEEFDVFFLDATSKDLPLSAIEERCEQLNRDMADLQKSLDEELIQVLMTLHFVTPELLAQLRTIFGRDAGSVMLQFRLEVDRQQKRAVDEALERARQEDIQKEEIARLIAKREFKEKRKREVEAAKLAKIEAMKALESSRMKQKREFELTLGESAKSEDFSDLDDSFFVFLHRYDLRRRPVLILKMANFPPDPCLDGRPQHEDFEYLSEDWQQRVMRYVILKLDSILDAPYSTHGDASRYLLVVDFTDSSSSRRPSIVFLHQAWHILPDRARSLMDECVIIDSPFWFRAFVWYLKPLVSPRVWKKVRFIKSYSDLWGTLSHSDLCNISSTDKYGNKKVAFSGGTSDISGKPSFLSMLSRARTAHLIKGQDSLEFFEKYFEIINGAKVADWSEIIDLHFLDTTGVDILGRPVIMFIASNFTCKLGDSFLNRCLVYIMLKVHELMFEQKKHVSILVVCSNITTQNIPSTTWLSAAAKKFPYRIRKMIQCIYILNPGFLVKKVLWALRSIVSPKIANKIIEVETILQLLRYFNHSDLKLPPSVLQDVPFGGTPEEMKMMMAEIRAAMKRGIDAGLDQTVDFSQQFKRGLKAPSDHDIETFFTITYKDFEDINGKDIVKFAGRDLAKRPMVSITLANIPAAKGEIVMNKLFRLVVLLLQPLSQLPYSIAVIATRFAAANSPAIEWMRDIHKSIDSSARKNLRAVYMFEPTFLIKSVTFGLQQFISSKFFKKVFLITDSDDFYQHIDPNHCKLPKSLISQFVRAPAPVAPLKESAPSAAVVPPQFAAISSSRFVELQSRKLADFGDEFDDLAQVSGIDIFGDPVIVIDGGKVNSSSEEAFISAIFYLLALAKENVNDDESFSVAYCDDDLNDKTPSSDWLRGAYNMIPKYLRKNIKHLFCINSSQSLRMFFWFANTFVSAKFAQKIVHILDTADLAEYLDTQETKLPPSVVERLPLADAKKMSLAMVRRSRALMSRRLVAPQAAPSSAQASVFIPVTEESADSPPDIVRAAYAADKTAAALLDCIYLSSTLDGLPCVMIQVCKLPDDQYPQYREVMIALFMLLIVSIDSASKAHVEAKYCLFLSNVDSDSENRPSMEWLRAFHAQLPHQMRKNCVHVFIYMPSLAMRAFLGTARLFLSSKFFKKIVNLTSESAAQHHFDVASDAFNRVSGKMDDTRTSISRRSSRASRRKTIAAPDIDAAADPAAAKTIQPNEKSQPNISSTLQTIDEQPQVIPEPQQAPLALPLVTRFRHVNGKPVVRSAVPLGQIPWATPYTDYAPAFFTSEGFPGSVRSSIRSPKNPLGQADPDDIHEVIHGLSTTFFEELRVSEDSVQSLGLADAVACTALGISGRLRFSYTGKVTRNNNGYPLNPSGRTGLDGRAQLLLWGPNHTALPLIVRCSRGDCEHHVQLLMTKIPASDAGFFEVWALPECAVPAGHCISPQLLKGLEEQALKRVDLFDDLTQQEIHGKFQALFGPGRAAAENILHAGVWDHAGNTDHAWSEAVCVLVLLEDRLASSLDNGSESAVWVPYDPSLPVNDSHRPLISEALLRLSQRGVCDVHGNVSPEYGGFSLSSSLAGLEKAVTSMFSMEAFPERPIKYEQQCYEELERQDGLFAQSTVEARRSLIVRYRKAGNTSAAQALEALDKSDVAGGVESFPKDECGGARSSSTPAAAASTRDEDPIESMMRLYQTRVRTLGLHDPLTASLRKQLCKEFSVKGRFDEAADLRSQAMSYDPQ